MAFASKTSIGRYEIISELGKGGMGEVYLAQDSKLDRKVAIKFLSEEFSKDPDKLNRFIQEAKAASALNHPNILTVYEVGEFEGHNYIVTENIDGRTLSDLLKSKPLDVDDSLNYAIQITSALSAAHEAGIIHRDIKANNVMIRRDGIAKLLDFGLAKLTGKTSGDDFDSEAETMAKVLTVPGMLMGTPNYMSPEQARGIELDGRTDIFSFGIMFFEMLTGLRPFDGESFVDTMGAILKDEHPPLSRFMQDVPPGLEHILDKTLRKDREKRYQSVKDLVIELKDLRDDLKFEAKLIHSTSSNRTDFIHKTDTASAPKTVHTVTTPFSRQRFSLIQIAGLLLLVTIIGGGVWWFTKSLGKPVSTASPANLKKTEIESWNSAPGELFSTGKFSPDGKMVAFSSTKSGSKNIWIKQPESGTAVQVTKDLFNNSNPIWSPEGNEIAFFSERGNQIDPKGNITGIWRIPTLGGTPISVAAIGDGGSELRYWSKSGKIYYESNGNLHFVDIASGKSTRLTDFSNQDSKIRAINISTDEKQIVYAEKTGDRWNVLVAPAQGGAPILVAESETDIASVVWHPDNKRVFYTAFVDGTFQIFVANGSQTKPVQLTFSESSNIAVDVSRDGNSILYGAAKEESNLWQVNITSGDEAVVSSSIESELWATVSKDNRKIAYQSIKNLSQGNNLSSGSILTKIAAAEGQTLKIAESGMLPTWSPDGSQLAFMRIANGSAQIWTVKDTGGKETKLTEGGIASVGFSVSPYNRIQTTDFSWSPDSRSIAYISVRNGFSNVWLVDADGAGDTQITNNTDENVLFNCPVFSVDGTKIAYASKLKNNNADGKIVYGFSVVDVNTQISKVVFEKDIWARLIGWAKTDKSLIVAAPSKFSGLPPEVSLLEVNIDTGAENKIIELTEAYYYNISLSNDKDSIAYVAHTDGIDNIWTVNSSGGKPKKITNNNDRNLYFSSLSWSPDASAIYFGKQSRYSLLSMLTNFQ